jgi:hypothetical protein
MAMRIFGLILLWVSSIGQDVDREKRAAAAKAAAESWVNALLGGDAEKTMALSAVPFAWDKKHVVETLDDLKKKVEAVVADKGKRDLKATKVEVESDVSEVRDDCFPVDRVIVRVMLGDEGILVCVRPGSEFRVVGFRD